jgi:hypothetical protein
LRRRPRFAIEVDAQPGIAGDVRQPLENIQRLLKVAPAALTCSPSVPLHSVAVRGLMREAALLI